MHLKLHDIPPSKACIVLRFLFLCFCFCFVDTSFEKRGPPPPLGIDKDEKRKQRKDDRFALHCCVADPLVLRRFEHDSSDSQKTENISVKSR
jgi:hypothetical protein